MSEKTTVGNVATDALTALQDLFFNCLVDDHTGFSRGLMNLASLPEFDLKNGTPKSVPGQGAVERGVMGFRRKSGGLVLALACGMATVRYLALEKFIAAVENMHLDDFGPIIVLQNPVPGEDGNGQIIMQINPQYSAIQVIHGVVGRTILKPKDIVLQETYYIDRKDLASFYIAAKCQLGAGSELENMIAAFDGHKGYKILTDPLNPHKQQSSVNPFTMSENS